MNKTIDFYFDFVSPYSYLAHKRIHKIKKEKNIKLYKSTRPGNGSKISPKN